MNEMSNTSLGRGFLYGLPLLSILFISWQPAALQLYFAASGFLAWIQAYLINTPSTRSILKMAPLPAAANEEEQATLRIIENQKKEALRQLLQQRGISQNDQMEMKASATKEGNESMIDKMMSNAKKQLKSMKTELGDKANQMAGKPTSEDTTYKPKPRLTDQQRKEAQAYKLMREEEDRALRELAKKNRPGRDNTFQHVVGKHRSSKSKSAQI